MLCSLFKLIYGDVVVQRLCEELEYSELIDRAVDVNDPFERMVGTALEILACYLT